MQENNDFRWHGKVNAKPMSREANQSLPFHARDSTKAGKMFKQEYFDEAVNILVAFHQGMQRVLLWRTLWNPKTKKPGAMIADVHTFIKHNDKRIANMMDK